MIGARRADPVGGIGRRRGERFAGRGEQRLHRAVRGHADRDRVEPGGDGGRNPRLWPERQHQRERPRPERLGQRARGRIEHRDPLGRGQIGDMNDQRVEARPALGGVDTRDRRRIGGVGGEAVDRFGGDRDHLARRDQPRRLRYACIAVA